MFIIYGYVAFGICKMRESDRLVFGKQHFHLTFVHLCLHKFSTIFLLIFDHNGHITIYKVTLYIKGFQLIFLNQNHLYVSELQ